MGQLTCCIPARIVSTWVPERDLESAGGFDYMLGKCRWCGAPWMNVFCTATGITGYERVKPADVEALHSIHDDRDVKEFMRRWGDKNL